MKIFGVNRRDPIIGRLLWRVEAMIERKNAKAKKFDGGTQTEPYRAGHGVSRTWKSRKGWAMSLSCGEMDSTYDYSFFSVIFELTDAGHEHHEDIIGLLFRYIQLLQESGVLKWIFDELVAICEMGFHYKDKVPPINYVMDIAANMQLFPSKDWIVQSTLPTKFVPSTIQKMLNELSPHNVRIFWESKTFEGITDLVEPWYGTKYSVQKITPSTIQVWTEKAPKEKLHLPIPNMFIATDLTIKQVSDKVRYPSLLRKSPFSKLWYKPDTMFFTPKAYVKIEFNCPLSSQSPEAAVLTDIFTRLLIDYLNEYAYYAQVAGLNYNIIDTASGFQVIVCSTKLSVMMLCKIPFCFSLSSRIR
ncbi:hypothetical protein HPP92_027702 [Vanilla planifolia]|uniref:Peptidase M16 middle/third domain-containing protein n=1 Tax=Vanilla planifolia TaxID=51239 RepID=A0A835P8Y4_VANPL|nr:hypothetical protein HPP92_027702 [Vanilla planifolia]KAG0448755.1 hypothetical protein HPP92_027671 [Vanilla planifolia]